MHFRSLASDHAHRPVVSELWTPPENQMPSFSLKEERVNAPSHSRGVFVKGLSGSIQIHSEALASVVEYLCVIAGHVKAPREG